MPVFRHESRLGAMAYFVLDLDTQAPYGIICTKVGQRITKVSMKFNKLLAKGGGFYYNFLQITSFKTLALARRRIESVYCVTLCMTL